MIMKKNNQNRNKIVVSFLGLFCILAFIFFFSGYFDRKQDVISNEVESNTTEEVWDDNINILTLYEKDYYYDHDIDTYLFLGTDKSGNPEGTGEEYQGSMADFLALLVMDKTEKSFGIIHLNRETMTEVSMLLEDDTEGQNEIMQLCIAHWYGSTPEVSCQNTVDAVSWMLGALDIQGYYAIPMEAIPIINGMVDGVTVTIEDDFSDCDDTLKLGETITLNDEQALHFVQGRMSVGDGMNRSRMRRQEAYIAGLSDNVKERSQSEPDFPLKIYEELQEISTSDINGNQISKIINRLLKYENKGNFEFEGITKTGKILDDKEEHSMFYPEEESVVEIMKTLFHLQELEDD